MPQKNMNLSKDVEVTSSSPNDGRLSKRWGYIAAYPHEYLIHFRKGKQSEKTSGQGASCFKWPRDTVFIIPTSLKEIVFEANQLSADDVDVRLRGMAIYRINKPLQIYTLLNFSNRQQAEEKLARMIGDLCRSTAKWLVANMGVEECMRKRKEDIAEALKQEVSVIVADDKKGWGVEIVTIDIQDVYIQDVEIFNAMQMPFKTDKIRESELIQLEMKKNLEVRKLEQESELAEHRKKNELEEARIKTEIKNEQIKLSRQHEEQQFALERYRVEQNSESELIQLEMKKNQEVRKLEQEGELAEHRKKNELEEARIQAEIKNEQIKLSRQNEEQQFALDHYRVEQNEAIGQYKLAQELDRKRHKLQLKSETAQQEMEAKRAAHQIENEALQQRLQAENTATPASLEKNFIENALPTIADALAKNMSNSRFHIIQQDGKGGTPFKFVLTELMDILRDRMEGVASLKEKQE